MSALTPDDTTEAWLRDLLATSLGVDPSILDPHERLHRYGLTSLTAATVIALIADRLRRPLSPTLLWDHPTLHRLALVLDGQGDPDAWTAMQPMTADEPIAIVGMACRLPGAESLDAYWRMLCAGTDAISEVPPDRWDSDALTDADPLAPGRMATRWGGFIPNVDLFDAAFFGMSPREAAQTDPQQRLALELAWESLEDAGIRPRDLNGSRTGVFIGAMWSDYARLLTDRGGIAQHTATGQDISIVSARIAYVLGLKGPALTIDTACSSALVAVHQACRSLRAGESTVALAGGVHLLLAPESSIAMTKFGAMASDGRCKPFDIGANGYVRGEGGGLVILKPLRAARMDGNRIYAVIRGSAMNNDGPSNGLTAPNPAAQRDMLRDALADAKLHPHEVDYVEAHGTGTALGDPIEANAIAAVLTRGRPADRPLRIGSVKSNIGHLEAAAGAAGLIKLALALCHRWLPPSLHFQTPNPAIDFAGSGLAVQIAGTPWPSDAPTPIGGVSSFGFGGTNCHLLLQAAPISDSINPPSIAAPPAAAESVVTESNTAKPIAAGPVFVFAGNGGNWPGMARGLMAHPTFAVALSDCDSILSGLGYPASVIAVLDDTRVTDVALGQPALCAFQIAMTALLESIGVRPTAVIGHSVGEASAACAAGALTRTQALRLVLARSRLQARVAGQGGMALAAADAEAIRKLLPDDVVIAGENGPRATLLAGTPTAVARACSALDAAGIVSQPIDVPVAYHSPQMNPLRSLLERELADMRPAAGSVPIVSTVTGSPIDGLALDASYWGRNLRDPVRFRQGIANLLRSGHRVFLELAPHPLLAPQLRQMAPDATVVSPVRRGQADMASIRRSLGPVVGPHPGTRPRHLLVLSARTPQALDALRLRWAARLPDDFPDLCHTALVGRERFPHRLALHAADGTEARKLLLAGKTARGEASPAVIPDFDQRRQPGEPWETYLDRCAAAFVAGADLDGRLFDADGSSHLVAAPTYPFERERHWLPRPDAGLGYIVAWQPFTPPDEATGWPEIHPTADIPDHGLDAEATAFVHAALAAVPADAIAERHRPLADRLATWNSLPATPPIGTPPVGTPPVGTPPIGTPPVGKPPAATPPAALLRRAGKALPALLRGEVEPLEVLFPNGDLDEAARVYQSAPFAAAQHALAAAIGALGRPLRVLELGAGTGALTAQLLAIVPPGSTLLSTDVSEAFLVRLRRQFANEPALRTAHFDIDDPAPLDGPFDVIAAANVLHAGRSIPAILSHLRHLLIPGGMLGIVELLHAPRWIDLVFGLTEGWWRFRGDIVRPGHALLNQTGWQAALDAAGFADIAIRPDGDAHAIVLARAPRIAERRLVGRGALIDAIRPAHQPGAPFDAICPTAHQPEAHQPEAHQPEAHQPEAHQTDTTQTLYCPGDAPAAELVAEATAMAAAGATLTLLHGSSVPHAAVAGATRALLLDRPGSVEACIEALDQTEATIRTIQSLLGRTGHEDNLRIQAGTVSVARLARVIPTAAPPPLSADRLYVIAGGFGHLGQAFARFLVSRGARHLLLVGRTAGDPAIPGANARALSLDLTAPNAAKILKSAFDRPLGGVIHAAGLADGPPDLVLAAKLGIAETLSRAAQGLKPDFLLLFSSAAGVWGTSGHVAYAAANAALNRWAEIARTDGTPATAVAFGRFQQPGLLSATENAALDAAGLLAMAPEDAFVAALQAVADGAAVRVVASVDWPRFRATFEARRPRTLFDRFSLASPTAVKERPLAPHRLDKPGIAALLADVLGHPDASRIDPERGLFEQGLDSLMAVTLRRRLEDAAGSAVPAAVLFAHPTVSQLADWIAGATPRIAAASPRASANEPVAIVGIGCRFAGGADSPDAFLAQLMAGSDAIGSVPPSRPTAALWTTAPPATRHAGFLDGVELFDAAFFGISPREAAQLDPQQRLLLETAWRALEHAGIAADGLKGSRTGIFVGATGSDYASLARSGKLDAHSLVGQPSNTLAGRLAYQFGLHGPALTIDTACSSSLVALHLAVRALRSGEADAALAGGVNLLLTPDTSVMLAQAGLLAPDGRCKVFDAAADGYVRGEGCGVVVLKTLKRAREDGDRVLAVIRGSAVNHDGRSSSFTAPNGSAQAAVIRDALADAGLKPDDIDFIEAHGTGTALGDPIELDALAEVFAGRHRPLPVGSVKAALGHTEAAAGIAGVIKAALCLNAHVLPPRTHFNSLNPHARTDTPVTIGGALPPTGGRAGVSAFGASGTNAHVLLECGDPPTPGDGRRPLPATRFDRLPFWLAGTPARDDRRTILGVPHHSARSGETTWDIDLDPSAAWLRDHVVDAEVILPAAAFLDFARTAGIEALTDVAFRLKLNVPPDGVAAQLVLDRAGEVRLYAEDATGWVQVATARTAAADVVPARPVPPLDASESFDGLIIAAELAARGFHFGASYQTVRQLTRSADTARAQLIAAELIADNGAPLIDAALQTLSALLPNTGEPWLPARIGQVAFLAPPHGEMVATARLRVRDDHHAIGDAWLERPDGTQVMRLEAVELRPTQAEPGAWYHDVVWRPSVITGVTRTGSWHAIGPGAAVLGCDSFDETGNAQIPPVDGIIDLRPMTAATPSDCILTIAAVVRAAAALPAPPQLILVSRAASAAPPVRSGTVPPAAVLMGLQPVIEAEHPALRCRWIDLDPSEATIPPEWAGPPGRYALRHGRLLVPEVVKAPPLPPGPLRVTPGPERSLADVRLVPHESTDPASNEVLIAVTAAGLNFKDVLTVLGRAPDDRLGLECVGTVLRTGTKVTGFAPGDRVLAFGPGALASQLALPATQVIRCPDWLDDDTAASLPVACLTAWHGLHDLAAVGPGTRVLIHAGAGGVGGMAIALARLAGARVFATTSAGKEAIARAAGADAVGDSRSPAFAGAARVGAGSQGFDVVLNALGPEIAVASAALLRPDGLFLEIGNAPRPPGVARHIAYDLNQPMDANPAWFADTMARILDLLHQGLLRPPLRTVLPLALASEAFQALGQGRTVGKLVLCLPTAIPIRSEGTYLVTGGTGAVGQAIARWLVTQGAGRVVLAARHPHAITDWETAAIDVADRAALANLLRTLPNLRGVIHAAGIVRDGTLDHLDPADIAAVLAPKIDAASHLDALTRGMKLDFFLLVSSTSGVLSAPGQAAYASANAWLDRFAASRRAAGLPAVAIGSGPWAGGMFNRLDPAAQARLRRDGFRPMSPRRAAAAFARTLDSGAVYRLVMDRVPPAPGDILADGSMRAALLAVSPGGRLDMLRSELAHRLTTVLGFPVATRIEPHRALRDMGLDSLLSISLRNELAAGFGLDLPTTLLFDHPTLAALANYLLGLLDVPLESMDEDELAALLEREL